MSHIIKTEDDIKKVFISIRGEYYMSGMHNSGQKGEKFIDKIIDREKVTKIHWYNEPDAKKYTSWQTNASNNILVK